MTTDSLRAQAQWILSLLAVSARKKLGQNFMVDEDVLGAIASAIPVVSGERVIEIGPGIGFLTRKLLDKNLNVTAIEMDKAYAQFLPGHFAGKAFNVLEQDFLDFDLLAFFGNHRGKIYGNIPYNITTPILEKLILSRVVVSDVILTTQWEVAERMQASPGSKIWGPLSLFVQFYASIRIIQRIPRSAFWPAPQVDSAILHLRFYENLPWTVSDEATFFKIVRGAFQKRRKTLLNALEGVSVGCDKETLRQTFKQLSMDPVRRPETLTIQEWTNLSNSLK